LHPGQCDKVKVSSRVDNTLLLKQEAPMLRTNQAATSRELYGSEAGACVILPARIPASRIPFGYVEFEVRYRFAGRIQPGVASKPPLPTDFSVQDLKDMLHDKLLKEA